MKENVGESGVWAVCYFDCKQASSSRYFVFGPGVCKRIGDFMWRTNVHAHELDYKFNDVLVGSASQLLG